MFDTIGGAGFKQNIYISMVNTGSNADMNVMAGKERQDIKSLNGRGLQLALEQPGKGDHQTSAEAIRSFPSR